MRIKFNAAKKILKEHFGVMLEYFGFYEYVIIEDNFKVYRRDKFNTIQFIWISIDKNSFSSVYYYVVIKELEELLEAVFGFQLKEIYSRKTYYNANHLYDDRIVDDRFFNTYDNIKNILILDITDETDVKTSANLYVENFQKLGLPFFEESERNPYHIIYMIEKDNGYYPNKTILSSDPIMFTWHFRRIWIAHKANSTYLEQYITDMIRSSDEYYDKPALDYHLEIIERIKKLIAGVPLEELGLIQAEFPTKVKALLATQSEIVEKEGLITQTTTIPVGNIDLMGISIVKGYRKDFVEAFIKACETPLFLDPDDEVTLADAARDFNSDVMYFAADEAEGWTAITIMAEDIADVMPSIRDEKSFVDEMLAELFPNAPIVTLNQYDTVGAFGFAVTEQGQKRRGYFNVEGNEYENYGEPLPEEKEHSALDTAMFYITKRLTGFAFTEKNINKYFQAIKLK